MATCTCTVALVSINDKGYTSREVEREEGKEKPIAYLVSSALPSSVFVPLSSPSSSSPSPLCQPGKRAWHSRCPGCELSHCGAELEALFPRL